MPSPPKAVHRPASRTAHPRRATDLKFVALDDGFLAFRGQAHRMHRLNATASLVLELCNGARSAEAIAELVGKTYGLKRPPTADVSAVLLRMASLGLVTRAPAARRMALRPRKALRPR